MSAILHGRIRRREEALHSGITRAILTAGTVLLTLAILLFVLGNYFPVR